MLTKDLKYIPGDLCNPLERHKSHVKLLKHIKQDDNPDVQHLCQLNDLYLEKDQSFANKLLETDVIEENEMTREVTEKPGEQNTAPIIPAYCNFQVARKMHVENLEHQPLPDSIMDKAYRRLQAQGAVNPELALDVYPVVTGKWQLCFTSFYSTIFFYIFIYNYSIDFCN